MSLIHLLLRGVLSVAAIGLIAIPIVFALGQYERGLQVSSQHDTPPADISAPDAARWQSVAAWLPAVTAPVVLAYHDIRSARPGPVAADHGLGDGLYNVGPERFDEQLTMLQRTGYRSLTASGYIAYLRGGATPARSVLITFDGATQDLWSYADTILARHHMHAVAFLDLRAIGTHWTRQLSWPEIARMQASRRWSFGPALTRPTPTARGGIIAPVNGWAAARMASIRTFRVHGLPAPTLLTWPAPTAGAATAAPAAALVVRDPFVAAFVNHGFAPMTSRRAAAGGLIGRIQVTGSTAVSGLLETVASLTAIPVSGADPLAHPSRWTTSNDTSPVTMSGHTLRLTAAGTHQTVIYAPDSTADWQDYVLDATINGLTTRGNSGSVLVRIGSGDVLTVRVSARTTSIVQNHANASSVHRQSRLVSAPTHHVRIVVRATATLISVDHSVTFELRQAAGPGSAGGIGLAGFRRRAGGRWPSFSALTIAPATPRSTRPDHLTLIPPTRPPLAVSSLWLRNQFTPAAVRAASRSLVFTAAGVHDYAAFAPIQTSRWTGYAFTTTAGGLVPGDSVDLYARLGSSSQVLAIVGPHAIKVYTGPRASRSLVAARTLANATSHRISLRVLARATLVQADGMAIATVPAIPGAVGGIAVGAKHIPPGAWPRLTAIALTSAR